MSLASDLSIWGLVVQASFLVKLVMLGLLIASIASWVVIFKKRRLLRQRNAAVAWFEDRFWSGGNLNDIYTEITERDDQPAGLEALFRSGFEELRRQRTESSASADEIVASVQRAMRVATSREVERLEGGLALLATVGSTSPYVGLFGTVWGIMSAFVALGDVQQATLSMVAPGIAEALIATAMGLFAAIPAVVAYNLFTDRVDGLESRYQTFAEELSGIVHRGLRAQPAKPEA